MHDHAIIIVIVNAYIASYGYGMCIYMITCYCHIGIAINSYVYTIYARQ